MSDDERLPPLDEQQRELVETARDKAFYLYEGTRTPHRSCGIALAETFSLRTEPYQALRRGGITGRGMCGAVRGGEQILGELLGDPEPTGAVTDALRRAIVWYQAAVESRIDRGSSSDLICLHLTEPHGDFAGAKRHQFCTQLVATVAELVAEALVRFGPPSIVDAVNVVPPPPSAIGDTP